MQTLIIVPAYNEASVIGSVITDIKQLGYEVVVVDDGSEDITFDNAYRAGAILLRHCVNLGQGAALQTGIDYARRSGVDIVVTFDADGQHNVSDIPKLLQALQDNNVDIVLGSRFLGDAVEIPTTRRLLLKLALFYTKVTTGLNLTDVHNGLRAFKVQACSQIHLKQNRMAHASEILHYIVKYKLRYMEVPCTVRYTPYSLVKGQRNLHSLGVLAELLIRRLHK